MNIFQVDSFTNERFKGNPAGVCLLEKAQSVEWMQNIAAEMNLSETAFVVPKDDYYDLRWFTPKSEVDLCGHATLASAHIMWEQGVLKENESAEFESKSGRLSVVKKKDWYEMDFPAQPEDQFDAPPILVRALGVNPVYVGKNDEDVLIRLGSEQEVLETKPDFSMLADIPVRGIIVTAESDSAEYDFVSRFFAPAYGINEDPVTGSAHCCLGPFWKKIIKKNQFMAYQASRRGGVIRVKVNDTRVFLGGQAVTIFGGKLFN